jgi:hypothetical protein
MTVERDPHLTKNSSGILSTADGMQIDESEEHSENARDSRYKREEGDSKVTLEREEQPAKQRR